MLYYYNVDKNGQTMRWDRELLYRRVPYLNNRFICTEYPNSETKPKFVEHTTEWTRKKSFRLWWPTWCLANTPLVWCRHVFVFIFQPKPGLTAEVKLIEIPWKWPHVLRRSCYCVVSNIITHVIEANIIYDYYYGQLI